MQPDMLYPIDEPAFTYRPVAPMQLSLQVPRKLQTYLTDKDFEDCGLTVFKADSDRWLNPYVEVVSTTDRGDQWLTHGPANDRISKRHTRSWREGIERRVKDLRAIAVDEGLAFDEESAEAAIAFLLRLPAVRRPGVFLVNGNVRLVWDKPEGQQVGLQFRGKDKIQFIILQTDGNDLGSLMGIKSSDAVFAMIMAPDALPLIADA